MSRFFLLLAAWTAFSTMPASAEPWWKTLSRDRVAADPHADYTLAEENGPWLVMAASFSGDQGEAHARQLVHELRRDFKLPAFYYAMTFRLDDANPGRGVDNYGGKIRRRYNRGSQVLEHAVLVGEFPSIEDPDAQQTLERIKHLTPASLAVEGESNAQSLAGIRKFQAVLRERLDGKLTKGPMGHAFLTRNPLLPQEFFVPQGVDKELVKLNENLEFTLLKCPGKFSIRVATFKGKTSLKVANDLDPSNDGKPTDALVKAAQNAHFLTEALRKKGWEAYEFHDRYESYVTIGAFQEATPMADGSFAIDDRDAQIITYTFSAASPENSFSGPSAKGAGLAQLQKKRFEQLLSKSGNGQLAGGFHPKQFVGLPFDIYPQAQRVPRQSISADYARN